MKSIKVLMLALLAAFTLNTVSAQIHAKPAKTMKPAAEKKVEKKADTTAKKVIKKTKKVKKG